MFKDGKLKFYVDPAFTDENNENSVAIFTYENIPLKCICNEMIFVEVKNGMILDKRKEVFKKWLYLRILDEYNEFILYVNNIYGKKYINTFRVDISK